MKTIREMYKRFKYSRVPMGIKILRVIFIPFIVYLLALIFTLLGGDVGFLFSMLIAAIMLFFAGCLFVGLVIIGDVIDWLYSSDRER